MRSNKELTTEEFMVSHFCKLAMNALQNYNDPDMACRCHIGNLSQFSGVVKFAS